MPECTHGKAQDYVRAELRKGDLSRGNSHVQTIMGAKDNCKGCKSFVETNRLDTKLY